MLRDGLYFRNRRQQLRDAARLTLGEDFQNACPRPAIRHGIIRPTLSRDRIREHGRRINGHAHGFPHVRQRAIYLLDGREMFAALRHHGLQIQEEIHAIFFAGRSNRALQRGQLFGDAVRGSHEYAHRLQVAFFMMERRLL